MTFSDKIVVAKEMVHSFYIGLETPCTNLPFWYLCHLVYRGPSCKRFHAASFQLRGPSSCSRSDALTPVTFHLVKKTYGKKRCLPVKTAGKPKNLCHPVSILICFFLGGKSDRKRSCHGYKKKNAEISFQTGKIGT